MFMILVQRYWNYLLQGLSSQTGLALTSRLRAGIGQLFSVLRLTNNWQKFNELPSIYTLFRTVHMLSMTVQSLKSPNPYWNKQTSVQSLTYRVSHKKVYQFSDFFEKNKGYFLLKLWVSNERLLYFWWIAVRKSQKMCNHSPSDYALQFFGKLHATV